MYEDSGTSTAIRTTTAYVLFMFDLVLYLISSPRMYTELLGPVADPLILGPHKLYMYVCLCDWTDHSSRVRRYGYYSSNDLVNELFSLTDDYCEISYLTVKSNEVCGWYVYICLSPQGTKRVPMSR